MVREKKGKPRKYYLLFSIGGLLTFIFYVWECAEVVTLSYRISELNEEVISMENKNGHLKAKLYSDTNLANIDRIAREKRGMVFPGKESIIFLKVNSEPIRISSGKAFLAAPEDSKDASKDSHRQFYPGNNLYSYHFGN